MQMKLDDDREIIPPCQHCGRHDFISVQGLMNHITRGHHMFVSEYEKRYGKIKR